MTTAGARSGRFLKATSLLAALALTAAACGSDNDDENGDDTTTTDGGGDDNGGGTVTVSGDLVGAGASAQSAAMQGWQAGFQGIHEDVTISYDPVGSGGGRTQFLDGGTDFGGTDRALNEEEIEKSKDRCEGDLGAINLPHYISPIAVAFNLPGVDTLQLTTDTLAGIFAGTVTEWDDPAIVATNEGVDLPSMRINAVHRSDESGTSANFTDYLSAVAPDVWTYGSIEVWPVQGGEGAQGTSGVIAAIKAGEGSIGYADASQVSDDLGTVAVQVGDEFVPFSPEAAAKILEVSEKTYDNPNDFAYTLVRDTTESGVYPIVLVSYHIVCLEYADAAKADLVREFMLYAVSEEGQAASAASAGSAPVSPALRAQITEVVSTISGS